MHLENMSEKEKVKCNAAKRKRCLYLSHIVSWSKESIGNSIDLNTLQKAFVLVDIYIARAKILSII